LNNGSPTFVSLPFILQLFTEEHNAITAAANAFYPKLLLPTGGVEGTITINPF